MFLIFNLFLILKVLSQGSEMVNPRIESDRSFMVYDSRTFLHDLDPSKGNVPTLFGYFNVTVEDSNVWENYQYIRMCIQMYKDMGDREMIRFIN